MNILLTGGAGYIGAHTAVVLVNAGHKLIIFDNLSNSSKTVIALLIAITKSDIILIEGDIRNSSLLESTLFNFNIDAVIHFAGLKSVGESVVNPIAYYDNNVGGTISLLRAMSLANVKILIFSSSATVYGVPQHLPIDEGHPISSTNPYGRSKCQIEDILKDVSSSDSSWKILCLRYFNPVGAHSSGLIGEDPKGVPNNLMPYIAQVASGRLKALSVYGGDYPTYDGTGIRDFIHVMDLAEGHLAALNYVLDKPGWDAINLGTGQGYSVIEVLTKFSAISNKDIPYQIVGRRPGDVAACFAKVDKAASLLGWASKRALNDMCESAWSWQLSKDGDG